MDGVEYFDKLINSYSVFNLTELDKILWIKQNPLLISELIKFRYEAHYSALDNATNLAYQYFNEFPQKKSLNPFLTKDDYLKQCDWLVTPYLFQSPYKVTKSDLERHIFYDLFRDWKPNDYCLYFYKKIREVFKDVS